MKFWLVFVTALASAGAQNVDCSLGVEQCAGAGGTDSFFFDGQERPCSQLETFATFRPLCWQYNTVRRSCLCHCDFFDMCKKGGNEDRPYDDTDEPIDPEAPPEYDNFPSDFVGGVCFSGDSEIETTLGRMTMKTARDIPAGSLKVRSVNSQNHVVWSPIRMWLHSEKVKQTDFLDIETEGGNVLTVTPSHLIYTAECEEKNNDINKIERSVKLAFQAKVGDCVLSKRGTGLSTDRILSIKKVTKAGFYTFTTDTGSVLVSNVAASCYAGFPYERLAHQFFTWLYKVQQVLPSWLLGHAQDCLHPLANELLDMVSMLRHS